MKNMFLTFECPPFVDEKVVLTEIQKMLVTYKCRMNKCGPVEAYEKILLKTATGVCKGRAIPPKYKNELKS